MQLLLLGGCGSTGGGGGNSTITVDDSNFDYTVFLPFSEQTRTPHIPVSEVFTSDSVGIGSVKVLDAATSAQTVLDGDQHTGNHVCGFTVVSKGAYPGLTGHTYHVDYYVSMGTVLPTSVCDQETQQAFADAHQ